MPASSTALDKPDFLDRIAIAGTELWFEHGSVASPLTTSIIDVRQFPYLSIWAQTQSIATLVTVTVTWFQDVAGTFIVGQQVYTSISNAPIRDVLVNEGPFCQIVFTFAGGGSQSIFLYVRGKELPNISGQGTNTIGQPSSQIVARITTQVLAAAGNVQSVASFVQRGWATFFCRGDAGGVFCLIETLDQAGAWQASIAGHGFPVGGQQISSMRIAMPANIVRLNLTNLSGGNTTVAAQITMGPTP